MKKYRRLRLQDWGSQTSVATEARYTRHPAVSDPMAPFMDHPGALEHFPTGSFWAVKANKETRQPVWP